MVRNTTRFKIAVETFQNSSDMSEAEAEVYVLRELAGWSRGDTARELDKSESTVDTQLQAAKKKARLPEITKIEPHKRVRGDDAVDIWFANDARLRYRAREDDDGETTIVEQTYRADDPDTVWEEFDLALDGDELHEVALETVAEYINEYRNDIDACRFDWAHVLEATTVFEA